MCKLLSKTKMQNLKPLTNLPLISRLSNAVIRILGCNPGPMTLQGTNTYLVGTGDRRVLIDSGDKHTSTNYIKLLDEVLKEEKATIEHLLITHWHHDHVGGVNAVQNLLKASSSFGNVCTVWKLPRSQEDKDMNVFENSMEWKPLENEQIIKVEGATLQVKYTPGHTSDHACLLMQNEMILFSGDCILGEGTAVFEDLHDYMLSLKKVLEIAPKKIYPGHGPVVEDPVSSINYYIEHRMQREAQILEVLQKNTGNDLMSVMDIVEHIYKETSRNLWPAAALNVGQHLQKLLKEGEVSSHEGKWRVKIDVK